MVLLHNLNVAFLVKLWFKKQHHGYSTFTIVKATNLPCSGICGKLKVSTIYHGFTTVTIV